MSRRLLGAVLLLAAGVGAAVGTFLPLYWEGAHVGVDSLRVVTSSWKLELQNVSPEFADMPPWQSPRFGVPIAVSAVLLVVAAALVLLPEHQRLAARYLGVGATGLMAGSVAATGMYVRAMVGNAPPSDDIGTYSGGVGEGLLVLVAAVVAAVVGVVLIHGRRAEPRPEGAVVYRVDEGDDDMDTPPFGMPVVGMPVAGAPEVPVVEVAQIPESEYERPTGGPDHTR
ncbi:hypothetical protein ACRAKI_27350 [Saccharothrix isguenensis]